MPRFGKDTFKVFLILANDNKNNFLERKLVFAMTLERLPKTFGRKLNFF